MTAPLHHAAITARLRASWDDAGLVPERVEQLVTRIRAGWEAQGWRRDALGALALAELRTFLDEGGLPAHAIAHWMFSPHHAVARPLEQGRPVGVELHRDSRMVVEATFRFPELGEIVERRHSGATALLEGMLARSEWSWQEHEQLAEGVRRGALHRTGASLLRAGDVRPVAAGLVEQTMVLTPTCLTLTVRTHDDQPESILRAPGLAFWRRAPSGVRSRQLALLTRMPAKAVPFAAETCAGLLMRSGSLLDAIELLDAMREHGYDRSLIQEVCTQAEEVHGEAITFVGRSLELTARRRVLEATDVGRDPSRRLLLFLLLQMPSKAAMVELVEAAYPDQDATRLLERWLYEARAAFGLADDDELGALLLETLGRGATQQQLFARLREEFAPEDVEALGDEIRALCRQLLEQPLFAGLFSEVRWRPPGGTRAFECVLEPDTLRAMPSTRITRLPTSAERLGWRLNPVHHLQQGDQLPAALRGLVPFAEELSTRGPILWVEQPHTRHWMPYWLPADDERQLAALRRGELELFALPEALLRPMLEAGILVAVDGEDGEDGGVTAWRRTMLEARASYLRHGYAVLPRLVDPLWAASLRLHYRALHRGGDFLHEREALGNLAMYLEGATRFLQHQLARTVAEIVGEEVLPSFCYTRIYGEGARLPRHLDRPNCVWNVSIPFDLDPETERASCWPLYVEHDGTVAEIRLEIGDGALFRGVSDEHWRAPQPPGHRSTFGFAMFAPTTFKGTLY